jgi:hypothetical protein
MKMLPGWLATLAIVGMVLAAPAPNRGPIRGKKVDYELHDGHFEKNNSGLKGVSSFLVLSSREAFDKVFGIARVIGEQHFVPADAFDTKIVVAVIKRGNTITHYKVDEVTAEEETLQVRYTSSDRGGGGGTARFASPLIFSLDRKPYRSVIFIENGKQVHKLKIER